ncbi:UDP-glucose 4-epimerase [Patellaria atrata CBS 101060]|uniref:UDP-glucose 4-epimerase n=1 Tax=Patellaria atrata CBS 101060 TaxID=1346257 RepID=A0A9P4VN45_9PEZI|nr:UDP-glucose 4-epimerase [Patellaria atrata CBS 101060]
MSDLVEFGALSPSSSVSSLATPVSTDPINTPDTDVSVLFDDDIEENPLDLAVDRNRYILVVGGLGYIGSHTVLELLKEGYNVIIVDDLSNSFQNVFDRLKLLAENYFQRIGEQMPALHFYSFDYRSAMMRKILSRYTTYVNPWNCVCEKAGPTRPRLVRNSCCNSPSVESMSRQRICRITGVIHFAAFKSVENSIREPIPYYQNNLCGLVNFLDLLNEFGVKNFVFSSSATVYGSMANKSIPLKEEHCVHSPESYFDHDGEERKAIPGTFGLTSPYGRTKFMGECILSDIAYSDPTWKITALRYFNPVGSHESGLLGEDPRQKPTNLVPVVTKVLLGEMPVLSIFGTDWNTSDGTAVRDFIHVVDLARGHIAALAAAASGKISDPFRTFNLGTGKGHTVREVIDCLQRASSMEVPVQEVGRRPGDVGFCIAEVKRAETELNWKAEKSLYECAVDVWNFAKKSLGSSSRCYDKGRDIDPWCHLSIS